MLEMHSIQVANQIHFRNTLFVNLRLFVTFESIKKKIAHLKLNLALNLTFSDFSIAMLIEKIHFIRLFF